MLSGVKHVAQVRRIESIDGVHMRSPLDAAARDSAF